ncbi:MAG TPA: phosphoribosylamine--glycine ligase [Candidatus Atribacteria bacterium]|nr:phosphoribosylamine--glycine ligase [Candidatus Atribacteria bacterium]
MKVMLIGSGGREHCIAWKVKQNPEVKELYCIPGNGGISSLGICNTLNTLQDMVRFAKEKEINLTLVGPEAPLAKGVVDLFQSEKLAIVGPNQNAARLESSKVYAKQFMKKYKIPTAQFEVFNRSDSAISYLKSGLNFPLVIKADGLAAGKGVFIVEDEVEAEDVVVDLMVNKIFGDAGNQIIVEECLEGEEATIMFLFDGKSYCILPSSQDHKRIGDSDVGPNTGGMGAYSPAPLITDQILKKIEVNIIHPFIEGIQQEKLDYRGVVYLGLMITHHSDIHVLEFNVRLGDPETQVVLPRLKNDWLDLSLALYRSSLSKVKLEVDTQKLLGVVLTSRGYPGNYEIGKRIDGLEDFPNEPQGKVLVFHAGTQIKDNQIVTAGGRVLNVCAFGDTLKKAAYNAYLAVGKISFENMYYRRDIGYRAFHREG